MLLLCPREGSSVRAVMFQTRHRKKTFKCLWENVLGGDVMVYSSLEKLKIITQASNIHLSLSDPKKSNKLQGYTQLIGSGYTTDKRSSHSRYAKGLTQCLDRLRSIEASFFKTVITTPPPRETESATPYPQVKTEGDY